MPMQLATAATGTKSTYISYLSWNCVLSLETSMQVVLSATTMRCLWMHVTYGTFKT